MNKERLEEIFKIEDIEKKFFTKINKTPNGVYTLDMIKEIDLDFLDSLDAMLYVVDNLNYSEEDKKILKSGIISGFNIRLSETLGIEVFLLAKTISEDNYKQLKKAIEHIHLNT